MKTQPQIVLIFMLLSLTFAEMPCNQYEFEEMGCVSSTYEACSWNDFLSSCQQTYSSNIGCSVTLNRLACISQMQYPDQVWAYCIFSGYCQDVSGVVTDCLSSLSKPACLAVVGKACLWADQCLEMTPQQVTATAKEAQNSVTLMNQSNIIVCQLIESLPVMHQQGAYQYLTKLVESYNSDPLISGKYQSLLLIPGCIEIDTNILNLIGCTDAGVNSVACSKITTTGVKCQFVNKACQYVTDVSQLNCYDIINKEACLSVTNIKQPCYWSDNKCLLYSGKASCTVSISPVSPSFCAAAAYTDDFGNEQECFYYEKKQKCSQLCRSTALQNNKKGCNQSNYGCVYLNNTCLFKGLKSQCGLIGQNKYSCMNVNENCQFVNGVCKIMKDLSIAKCTDNLNKQACLNLTKIGQFCQYNDYSKQCEFLKINWWDYCIYQSNVNENVCKKMTDSACYWSDGGCSNADTNISCTAKGLNRIGCLASTQSQCQWNEDSGSCQNVVISNTATCNTLKLVNEFTCKMVSYKSTSSDGVEINELCKYNDQNYSCETFVADLPSSSTYNINCLTPGLNKAGCLSVADPTIACRWTSTGCVQVTSVSSSCSGLMGVTAKVCALAVGDPCTYDEKFQRCTTSVEKYPESCTSIPVLNGQGCAFIEPTNKKCYFDSKNLQCLEVTTQLSSLDCAKSYPNKAACLAITTTGQKCQWNVYKLLCEQIKTPYINYCDELVNVGVNACIGYEDDLNYYIGSDSYCTNDTPTTCKLFDPSTDNTSCFTSSSPNLHACVALTSGQNCYFDTTTLKCTQMNSGQESILLQIQCKQGNKDLCLQIKTKDQYCVWEDSQKKCYHEDQCTSAPDQTSCIAVTQPCVFKSGKCNLVLSTNAINYECGDAANELACYQVAKQSCTFDGTNCIELIQDLTNDTCTTYADASKKVNSIACAKIRKDGEYCQYDIVNNKCITNKITTYDECNIGQNQLNCSYDNNCTYSLDNSICSSITSICTNALTLDDCMNTKDTCMWTAAGLCKYVPYDGTCTIYTKPPGYKYSTYTCGSVYASEKSKICAQNPDTLLCEEIVPYKCSSTTDSIDCTNVRNKCTYNTTLKICALSLANPKICSDNYTQFACLTGKLKCTWDLDSLTCNEYSDEEILCQKINNDGTIDNAVEAKFSAEVCYAQENDCYLDLTTLGCTKYNTAPTTCAEAKSPNSCFQLPDELLCYWDTDMICKALTDISKGASLTYAQVSWSQKTVCLLPQQEGEQTIWIDACYMPDLAIHFCSDDLNKRACQAIENDDPIQYCIYKDSKCQYADLNTTKCQDTINYYTCVSITTPGQYCVWLGQRCAFVNDDGYSVGKYSTVNMNTCKKTYTINGTPDTSILNPLGVKFSIDGCILSEPDIDVCTTPGLNYYGCLQSSAGSCTWNVNQCVDFTQFSGKQNCSDFKMVSAGVCSKVQGLKCSWQNYNCIDATTTQLCTDNLSQTACIIQTTNSCKWENNKCQNQSIISGITQCGNGSTFSTAAFSSEFSCQQVQFGALPCRHNGQGCTTELDLLTIKCNSPGLNAVACTMVKFQKCIFQDGKCQNYVGSSQQCRSLVAVSPQVCADITDSSQFCKYSRLNNKCTTVNNYDLCTSTGINQSGCNYLYNCKWHKDQNYCSCAAALNSIKFCADYDKETCKVQSKCIVDSILNICRAKVCSDLDPSNCQSSKMNNAYCYLTNSAVCASAQTCNDVRDVKDCTKIQINGTQCQTHIQGYCREKICSDNMTDATCNGDCYWVGTYCDNRVCQQFGKKEQCTGTYENSTCFWLNNMCFGLGSCYELAQYYDDQTTLQSICNSSTVNGNKCHWQLQSQYSKNYECSHNQCNPLGSSKLNCVGAEIDNFVCILSNDFQCMRCEDIVNECECSSYKGDCLYTQGKCRSIKCQEYEQPQCEQFTSKCMWHSDSKTCLVVCSKLRESDCSIRDTQTKLCYWESKLKRCNTGTKPVINIDTAQIQIQAANITTTVQNTGAAILAFFIYLLI